MAPPKPLILIVEDDKDNARVVTSALEREGYQVQAAGNLFQARGLIARMSPDLIILDRKLPDGDGLDLCREIRSNPKLRALPVLFLSVKDSVAEKVVGLSLGGDDYLPKPFSKEELMARVQALLRRSQPSEERGPCLRSGELLLDVEARKATLKGKALELWPKELDLLEAFLRSPGRVLSRQFLLERVWGYERSVQVQSRIVDATISNLRSKLGALAERLVSVKGHGYRWEEGL